MSAELCRKCGEPIVEYSNIPGVCTWCYHVLDLGRSAGWPLGATSDTANRVVICTKDEEKK
jgi:hypothetical protein